MKRNWITQERAQISSSSRQKKLLRKQMTLQRNMKSWRMRRNKNLNRILKNLKNKLINKMKINNKTPNLKMMMNMTGF